MKRVMRKIMSIGLICILLSGCGNTETVSEEVQAESMAETVEEMQEVSEAEAGQDKAEAEQATEKAKAGKEQEAEEAKAGEEQETEEAKAGEEQAAEEAKAGEEQVAEEAEAGETGQAASEAESEADLAETKSSEKDSELENADEVDAKICTDKENAEKDSSKSDQEDLSVKKEVTEEVTVYEQSKTMYATIALNVRRGPSTDYEVVSHLAMAQAVEVTGQAETGWYQLMVNGEPAYASHKYLSENQVQPAAPAQTPVDAQAAQPAVSAQAAPAAVAAPAGVIMVGDSRCVQMQTAVGGGGCSWVCENSKEYTWFVETAIPKFDQYVGNGTKVVINMGVNDPEHYNQYVETINAKAAEWAQRGAKTYLVSVNPVWENPYTTQEQVETFNANVPGMLVGVTWIDTHSWLVTNGYRVLDGLHYDDPTYVNIFNLIMGSL